MHGEAERHPGSTGSDSRSICATYVPSMLSGSPQSKCAVDSYAKITLGQLTGTAVQRALIWSAGTGREK